MSVKPRILVTGATGRTGAPTVEYLLENGFPVRAFVHRNDARSEALRKLGAEIRQSGAYRSPVEGSRHVGHFRLCHKDADEAIA